MRNWVSVSIVTLAILSLGLFLFEPKISELLQSDDDVILIVDESSNDIFVTGKTEMPNLEEELSRLAVLLDLQLYGWSGSTIFPQFIGPSVNAANHSKAIKQEIEQLSDHLKQQQFLARVAIDMSTEIEVDKRYLASLIIQPKSEEMTNFNTLLESSGNSTVLDKEVKTTSTVRARISSADLIYEDKETGWKTIHDDAPTVWTWSVSAPEAGVKTLIFHLEQQVIYLDRQHVMSVQQFPHRLEVRAGYFTSVVRSIKFAGNFISGYINEIASLVTVLVGTLTFFRFVLPLLKHFKVRLRKKPAPTADVADVE